MILNYIKERRLLIISFIIVLTIFSLMSFIYGLSIDSIFYSLILCIMIFLVFFIFDYKKFLVKNKELELLITGYDNIEFIFNNTDSCIEEKYQKLLYLIEDNKKRVLNEVNESYNETIDFYTLWIHNVKTPISGIGLILQDSNFNQKDDLVLELFKIERYTEMVLNFARLSSINNDLNLNKYNLETIIKSVVKKYALLFIKKNISLVMSDLDKNIVTDEKWFGLVIEQILSNSIKYTPNNKKIKIYTINSSLVIEDQGIGILKEDLPKLFEKGFTGFNGRLNNTSSGLGLYMSKKILDKLNQKIYVDSSSEGTTVKISYTEKAMIND